MICIQQLGGLQEKISEFEKLNAEVIAIAKMGDQFDVETTKSAYKISYTLIPKPNRAIVEDFGVSGNKFGVIIIDKKGRIRYKDISIYMQHSVTIILRELQGI